MVKLLVLAVIMWANSSFALTTYYGNFVPQQCKDFSVSKGSDGGEGILRYCDNGVDQMIYHSGELDEGPTRATRNRDLWAIQQVIKMMKKRGAGTFEVVTQMSGGGDMDMHQMLMMGVEDACAPGCTIHTKVKGRCDSACNQLHLTCVRGAITEVYPEGRLCEHATTGERSEGCTKCDRNKPSRCNICGPAESVREYKMRCSSSLKGRNIQIDPERKRMINQYAERLARDGIFDTSELTCILPPWARPVQPRMNDTPAPVGR